MAAPLAMRLAREFKVFICVFGVQGEVSECFRTRI